MPLIVKSVYGIPPEGVYNAVCVDVVDRGMVPNYYTGEPRPTCRIFWEVEFPSGRRIIYKDFYLSISPQSSLHKTLVAWRGKAFTMEELEGGFDLEKIIGANCRMMIKHRKRHEGDGLTFMITIYQPDYSRLIKPTGIYVRQERTENALSQQGNSDGSRGERPGDDDDKEWEESDYV